MLIGFVYISGWPDSISTLVSLIISKTCKISLTMTKYDQCCFKSGTDSSCHCNYQFELVIKYLIILWYPYFHFAQNWSLVMACIMSKMLKLHCLLSIHNAANLIFWHWLHYRNIQKSLLNHSARIWMNK